MAHVLVLVAQRYNGNELWPILKALKAEGHTWVTAAFQDVIQDEKTLRAYRTNTTIEAISSYDPYDALVFISGNPKDTEAHWKDSKCNNLVKKANTKGHPLAAICAAVPSLGPAINGVRVSSFPLRRVREALVEAGAIIQEESLYTDRNVVTAENEAMAGMWAANFCALLKGEPPKHVLHPSSFKRKLRERRPIPAIEYARKQNHD